jgi:hypothetical protein
MGEAALLESLVPGLPHPAQELHATQLQALRPDRQAMSTWIERLAGACDKLIPFTPEQLAQVDMWRAQTLADAQSRLGMLRQDVAMAQGIISSSAAVQMQTTWLNTMQGTFAAREGLIQNLEAQNRASWDRDLALRQGWTIIDENFRA